MHITVQQIYQFAPASFLTSPALMSTVIAAIAILIAFLQFRLAKKKLFSELHKPRYECLVSILTAIEDSQREISGIVPHHDYNYQAPSEERSKLHRYIGQAGQLFGPKVQTVCEKIGAAINEHASFIMTARNRTLEPSERQEAAMQVGTVAYEIIKLRDCLTREVKPFLYVGDVRRRSVRS